MKVKIRKTNDLYLAVCIIVGFGYLGLTIVAFYLLHLQNSYPAMFAASSILFTIFALYFLDAYYDHRIETRRDNQFKVIMAILTKKDNEDAIPVIEWD